MSIRSSNFYFQRTDASGTVTNYPSSDTYIASEVFHWNETSLPLQTIGSYSSNACIQTIAITLTNFIGRISIEATLEDTLTDDTVWFQLKLSTSNDYYMEFGDAQVLDKLGNDYQGYGTSGTYAEVIQGNYCYLKITIDRDYITTTPDSIAESYVGCIQSALINL